MGFPVLSLIIFIPLIAGLIILALPAERKQAIRVVALVASLMDLVLAFWVYFTYDVQAGGYQFVERMDWVKSLGIAYFTGVNGVSVPLVLLGAVVLTSGVMVSWKVEERPREFFAFYMFLGSSVQGVFCSLDLFMLFFFFELAVFPKYLMIAIWGYPKTRDYGSMKLTLYLFLGSVLSLVGVLAMWSAGGHTFDMLELEKAGFSRAFQTGWFLVVFGGFAILGGIFPFHSWAPDGHVAAPTAVSMMLAGVEMKVGAFAALRVAITLMPDGARFYAPLILALGTVNVVYGALIAMIQSDFKYVIGFSSVSHMGLVMIGFATLNREGLLGAGLQMFSHGIMTALFFAVVGMVYDRAHTRHIPELGGLSQKMPLAALGFIIAGLVSMGMPGFSGFVAEFPIFMGAWQVMPIVAIIAILGVIVTAGYILLVVRRVFYGNLPEQLNALVGDVSTMDKIVIVGLSAMMVLMGILPTWTRMVPLIESGIAQILVLLGGA
ncbi:MULTISPECIES: NuoM family protein [Anaerolinea]|uniref:complex I subunit 4 family protein n=1 Tax=Anaerolinea TaxID=233189 RepID=UPI0026352095|nr:NADH-quinone oxidoreductase subunit M [Anaerolinea thermophila]